MRRATEAAVAGDWPGEAATGSITLVYGERHRRRLRLTTDAGEELARESAEQGQAFLKTMQAVWPHDGVETLCTLAAERRRRPGYSVAVGACCGYHGVGLEASLTAFLHALAANMVSAALRTVPLGQTDGQRVTAALEPVLAEVAERARTATIESLGTATAMADWASIRHETQYTRLFRS